MIPNEKIETDQQAITPKEKWQLLPPKDPQELGKMACAMLGLSPNEAMKMAGIIVSGHELGLPPMTAARSIYIINGRPTLSAEMQRGLVLASPKCEFFTVGSAVRDGNDLVVTAEGKRRDGTTKKVTARRSQFEHMMKPDSKSRVRWLQYPERMLIAAASRWLIRDLFPDVISGFADFEEAGEGEYIDLPNDNYTRTQPAPEQPGPLQPPAAEGSVRNPDGEKQEAPKIRRRKTKIINPPDVHADRPEDTGAAGGDTAAVGGSADSVRVQPETESAPQEETSDKSWEAIMKEDNNG